MPADGSFAVREPPRGGLRVVGGSSAYGGDGAARYMQQPTVADLLGESGAASIRSSAVGNDDSVAEALAAALSPVLWAVLLLGEPTSAAMAAGGALILLACLLVMGLNPVRWRLQNLRDWL